MNGLPTADDLLGDCPDGTAVYACGPAPMLTAIRAELAGATTSSCTSSGSPRRRWSTARSSRSPIASTGETVRVGADETLLSALNRSGVHASVLVPAGLLRHLSHQGAQCPGGAVDHRDTLLTDPERDSGTDADLHLTGAPTVRI